MIEHPAPTDATIKKLYGTALCCGYPECGQPLFRVSGLTGERVLNSRVAHIHARSENGPRWDPRMTGAENRGYGNLILLCEQHASEIDVTPDRFPPGLLREWKRRAVAGAERAAPGPPALNDREACEVLRGTFGLPVSPLDAVTDPFALEVHRPVRAEDPPPDLGELTPYVRREHDSRLAEIAAGAAAGRGGLAMLVGESSSGKTRACWEALTILRDRPEPWRLWHPIYPSPAEAVLNGLRGIGPRTVVWLNDAQHYLDAPGDLGERVAAGLRELLRDPARSPVLILGTLWPGFWDILTRPGPEGTRDQARELLTGRDIPVPGSFCDRQLAELAGHADPRLRRAAQEADAGQVTQFLAGVPELLARCRYAPPPARAVIHAAMDARRLGLGPVIPGEFLKLAAPAYLTDAEWGAAPGDWLARALDYARRECNGVPGPLRRSRPRPGEPGPSSDGYRLSDYLEQHGRDERRGEIPPDGFWAAAQSVAGPGELRALGDAAEARGLLRISAGLRVRAAAHGDARAAARALRLAHTLGQDVRGIADEITGQAVTDDPGAVAELLDALHDADLPGLASGLLERCLASPATREPGTLSRLLSRDATGVFRGRAEALACVPVGDLLAVTRLARTLWDTGAGEEAVRLAERAARESPVSSPRDVAAFVRALHARKAGDILAVFLARNPAAQVTMDEPRGVAVLLEELLAAGEDRQAGLLIAREPGRRAALADVPAVCSLILMLRRAGAEEQAVQLAARVSRAEVSRGDQAVVRLAAELIKIGAGDVAAGLLPECPVESAELRDPGLVSAVLTGLDAVGLDGAARALLARGPAARVELGDAGAAAELLDVLRDLGADEQARTLLDRDPARRARLSDPWSAAYLLDVLTDAGERAQARTLAARAAGECRPDGRSGELLASLRRTGADTAVTAFLERLPREGMFALFAEQEGNRARYRFGVERDGRPARPWRWPDAG